MSSRRIVITLGLTGVLAWAVAGGTDAQPPLPGEQIAPGVSVAGVDVGTLTVDQATAKIQAALTPQLARDVTVRVAGRTFTLTPTQADVVLDPVRSAKRALYAGRQGAPATAPAAPGGTPSGIDVPPAVTHTHADVRTFVSGVRKAVARTARDATLKIGIRRVQIRRSVVGRSIDADALAKTINTALDDPASTRDLKVKLTSIAPKIDTAKLRGKAGTVITVEQSTFTLRLFKGTRLVKSYKVAVGQPAYPTPTGRFSVTNKQVNPVWSVPNSPWAGELAGTTVEGGSAANPLKARWMGLADGVGIHGTGEDYSIGSRASHGCIRMHVADVIDLYPRVPIGTPVLIR